MVEQALEGGGCELDVVAEDVEGFVEGVFDEVVMGQGEVGFVAAFVFDYGAEDYHYRSQ